MPDTDNHKEENRVRIKYVCPSCYRTYFRSRYSDDFSCPYCPAAVIKKRTSMFDKRMAKQKEYLERDKDEKP